MALVEDQKTASAKSTVPFQGVSSSAKVKSTDKVGFKSFEEVYRSSYSHGLEAIYTIETVDLKTVRRLGEVSSQKSSVKPLKAEMVISEHAQVQFEFDYGAGYREWMGSFVLQEPVHVLGLSRHAEKILIDQGLATICDLMQVDLCKWVFMKGMGQGHIDEIQQKLAFYIDGHPLERCPYIDFSSWLRGIMGTYSRKKVCVALEPYKLEELFTLSPSESVEVRRLPLEKRLEWRQEVDVELTAKSGKVFGAMQQVVEVFVKPWLLRRQGFATKEELVERLLRVSNTPWMVHQVLDFFSTVFYEERFPLDDYLVRSVDGLYFATFEDHQRFAQVVDKAMSYFYKVDIRYSLAALTTLLMREFAKSWQHFSADFISKALRFSANFRVRKAERGILTVRLA